MRFCFWPLLFSYHEHVAFFLLADGIGTTITLVTIAQTQVVEFSAAQNDLIVQGGTAVVGVFGAWELPQKALLGLVQSSPVFLYSYHPSKIIP